MALESGKRLGAYEVVDKIGSGGMGEVFRARDTKLKRDVALKVLPASFADDADRIARFQREAEILAALNHANIATIFGLEQTDEQTVIVMELVEGPTLADRIAEGPVPPDEAMTIAMQIIAALEAAHEKGIVHRDLKPANVKLRPDGTVKVLDFGISKPIDASAISGGSPVMTTPAVTQTGVILGTAAYMSPEQARGKFVDERTDIWAFGCLLFEMLTGQPAFGGEDVMLTLARVLDRDTDLSSIPRTITPAVRHTLKLCLEKDPKKRIADIRDVRMALEGRFESEYPAEQAAAAAEASKRRAVPLTVALVLGAVIVAGLVWALKPPPEAGPVPVRRFAYELPADQELLISPSRNTLALSPDGSGFVYSAGGDGQFYWRGMESLDAVPIRGASGSAPFFQPNAQRIGFFGNVNAVSEISLEGGVGRALNVALRGEATMTPRLATDGAAFWNHAGGVSITDAVDGEPRRLIEFDPALEASGAFLLPDGDTMIFAIYDPAEGIDSARIVWQSITSGEPYQELVPRGYDPRYLPTGHLLWVRDGAVWARGFDAAMLEWQGETVEVLSDVLLHDETSFGALTADYDVATDGTLVYAEDPGPIEDRPPYVWVGFDGQVQPLPFPDSYDFDFPRLSPDGRMLAVARSDETGNFDLWVYDFDRPDRPIPITTGPEADIRPVWTPNGGDLVFYRSGDGLYRIPADGTGQPELLWRQHESIDDVFPEWVHPAEPVLVFRMFNLEQIRGDEIDPTEVPYEAGIYRLRLEQDAVPEPFLTGSFGSGEVVTDSALSPDRQWMAYASLRSGNAEIYISRYPDIESFTTPRVSTGGGIEPVWGPNGSTLYYQDVNADRIMAVDIELSPRFDATQPVAVTGPEAVPTSGFLRPSFDIDVVNRRVLMRRAEDVADVERRDRIIIVENWFEELRRLVPID